MASFSDPAPPRRALAIWGAALAVYVVAVAGRTSLGVAGLQAVERFDISASLLSLFSVVQLGVYAAAQLPVGIALDRFGTRKVIAVGGLVLAVGQLVLALADTIQLALVARVLIGLGDATAFVAVLRLVPAWFAARRVPVITQLTGIVGSLGQIVSAVPFLSVLVAFGWTPAFVALTGFGLLMTLLAALVVRDEPQRSAGPRAASPALALVATGVEIPPAVAAAAARVPLRAVLTEPGMWLGFFTHFVSLFPINTFMLLWGVPFLTAGERLSPQRTSGLLAISVLAGIVLGPLTGELAARHPLRRSWLVLGAVVVTVLTWVSVLAPNTPRPMWQLVLLVVVLTGSATASTIGFDFARTYVAPGRLGTATAMVNVGGSISALISILLVGLVLDRLRPDGAYVLDDFRVAFASQGLLWIVGLAGVLLARQGTRRRMAERGILVPLLRDVVARIVSDRR